MTEHDEYMIELIDYAQQLYKEIKEKYPQQLERVLVGHMIIHAAECEHYLEVYQKVGLMK